jgi:hypothetical protein
LMPLLLRVMAGRSVPHDGKFLHAPRPL